MAHRRLLALASISLIPAALVLTSALPAQAAAAPHAAPAASQAVAAQGAAYLAGQIGASGYIPSSTGGADLGSTAQAVLALHAAGAGGTKATAAADYLAHHAADYLGTAGPSTDNPGELAYLILVAVASGQDPTAYGTPATDLVSRLEATRGQDGKPQDAGLFGAADPTYDGAFRQGLALAALHAAGVTDTAASGWLTTQQCADGGWQAYRANTSVPCDPADAATFSGEDTNSTAMALQGLVAQGVTPAADALTFLRGLQNSDGGFGYTGGATDANSTGVVLQALAAAGVDASTWTKGTATPYSALAALQLSCSSSTPGAFDYQGPPANANLAATLQAVLGAADAAFPIAPATLAADAPSECPSVTATPTATATTTTAAQAEASPTAAPSSPVTAGEMLPYTGSSDTWLLTGVGLALLVIGAAALVTGQRRTRAHRG